MRTKFDEQLEQLNVALITTGALCEDAISTAAKALVGERHGAGQKGEAHRAGD